MGNGVFHPVDYTLFNRKVAPTRLGHAYSVHGITGSLGWAAAPALVVPIALAYSWRAALVAAGCIAVAVLALLWFNREKLELAPSGAGQAGDAVRPRPRKAASISCASPRCGCASPSFSSTPSS